MKDAAVRRCLKPMLERLEERKRMGDMTIKALKLKRTIRRMPIQLTFSSIRREEMVKSAGRMLDSSNISYRFDGQPERSEWMRVLASHHRVVISPPQFFSSCSGWSKTAFQSTSSRKFPEDSAHVCE